MRAMTRATLKNIPAEYLVMVVRALPDPAPNRASVAAPPKAMPAPASFLGSCSNTRNTSKTQSKNINTVRNIYNMLIVLVKSSS